MADVESPNKRPIVGHSAAGLEECGDISMVTNVGSTIGEDANLSDCEGINQSTCEDEHAPENSDQHKLAAVHHVSTHDNGDQYETTPICSSPPQSPNKTHEPTLIESEELDNEIDSTSSIQTKQSGSKMESTTPQPSDSSINIGVYNKTTSPKENIEDSEIVADNSDDPSTSNQPIVVTEDKPGEGVAQSSSVTSIYLEDGETDGQKNEKKVAQPRKRLTMAQRATIEALESFGGIGLASVPVRKRDLHSELKKEAEQEKKKRQLEAEEENLEEPPKKRPRTRLQVAKQETEEIFHDIALTDGRKKNSRIYNLKANSVKSTQRSKVMVRQTRANKAKREALESFGGASLDTLEMKSNSNTSKVDVNENSARPIKRLTRVEQARLEALQSFGGGGLQDVMTESKRRIARTLQKPKQDKVKGQNDSSGEEEIIVEKENNLDFDPVPVVTNTE